MYHNPAIGLSGRITCIEILQGDRTVYRDENPKSNLLLNSGLLKIATKTIPELFEVAVKGTGTTPTTENPANTNTYTWTSGSTTLTRTAGARDFTADDVGKLVKLDDTAKSEGIILAYTSATVVSMDRAIAVTATNKHITSIYAVDQVALATEYDTTSVGQCFLQDGSGLGVNYLASSVGGGVFTSDMVGKTIYFFGHRVSVTILSFIDSSNVEVDSDDGGAIPVSSPEYAIVFTAGYTSDDGFVMPASRTMKYSGVAGENGTTKYAITDAVNRNKQILKRTFVFHPEIGELESFDGANRFSLGSGGVVTRTAGTRNFTSADIGKVISLLQVANLDAPGAVYEGKITSITSTTVVQTDHLGDTAAGYYGYFAGFNSYNEFGFSDLALPTFTDTGINIRVVLASALKAQFATVLGPAQQIKVTYQMEETVGPSVSTAGTAPIYDPGSLLSSNKAMTYCVESLALATIDATGQTLINLAGLEPSIAGVMGLSTDIAALAPLQNKIRVASLATTTLENDSFTGPSAGIYTLRSRGAFPLDEAIGTWRSLFLHDEDTTQALFTCLFAAGQTKDGNHALSLVFQKTWGRNLSS